MVNCQLVISSFIQWRHRYTWYKTCFYSVSKDSVWAVCVCVCVYRRVCECVCAVTELRERLGVNRQLIDNQPFKSSVRRKTH